mgnify:CR=1 FL=1
MASSAIRQLVLESELREALARGQFATLYQPVHRLDTGERTGFEALLRGPDEVLLLDEPDNYLDVPTKRWLEERLVESAKTVLFVSHDRSLLAGFVNATVADPEPVLQTGEHEAQDDNRSATIHGMALFADRDREAAGARVLGALAEHALDAQHVFF